MLYSTPAVATLTTLSPPVLPTTNAPDPACPAANVVSIYGDFYSPNIATNYNPNWGQSGFCCVNPAYNPGTGNVILAYPNFNYQGTELPLTNLSNMQFLNFDVWTDANPSTTTLQVSPINQGTGPAEVLVTAPYVRGQWTRISLPKSAFGGMTWDGVFQMKFAANGPGSLVPVDIYLDNIFFSTINCNDVTPPTVTCFNQTVTFNGQNTIPLVASQLATATDDNGTPTISINPSFITCEQVGQSVPVTVTATDASNNPATCISTITVTGLPCGWSQNPNGVNCGNGNSIGYNPGTGVWTATSTNCLYGPPFTSDATAFAQRTLCGDGSITAQVTDISGTSLGWAGVVMRESNAAGAKKAQLMTNLSSLSRREFRTTTNGAANPQQFPSQDRYWLRITRAGNQFSMYVSPNGLAWYFVGAQNIPMNACIQMGLVATNYQQTSTVTATFANVGFSGGSTVVSAGIEQRAESIEMPHTFEAYPNPTSGELNVNLAQYTGRAVRVELYSLTGQLLRFVEIEEVQTAVEQMDMSQLENGMYLVKVKSRELPDMTRRVVLAR
ncbi:MAG: T9SS type A sorting domain-containing protein [Saprospiraceae bacterium]|nr:T9SS type A sorting domain-containing protein [Saprospiraceae bacterium]